MRKQKRWIGVTAITGVTIVALTASVIIKKNLTNDVNEVINITEEGTNLGIKQIEVVTDKDGNVSGYKVNVETKGFGTDPIVMAVSFNATADEVTGLEIISHSETDGYGARITEDAFLSQFTGLKLPVYIDGMNVGTEKEPDKAEEVETNTNNNEATQLVDGTYEVKAKEASNGWTSQVSLTVAGGVITDVVWDAVNEAGEKKSVQSMNGQYVMTDNGPTWAEQAEALAAYVIENQTVDTLNLLDGGKTDTVASVSISITEFVDGVKECLELASGKAKPATVVLNDGTYEVKAKEASNGWTSQVSLTVAGGVITDVVWDAVNEAGEKKSVQSMNGQYVMTDNGPTWAEQAEALAAYVIENQTVDTLNLLDGGKTDTVASVSISITEFVDGVKECLDLASGKTKPVDVALKDGTYEVKAKEASNGWTSQVSLTVAGGVITDVVWDAVNEAGEKKSVQSMNGQYVMTDNGPTWAEQAEALAAYVIENQTVDTLNLLDGGKTDTVASVSISITEFVDGVKECLELASGTTAQTLSLKDGTYDAVGKEDHGWTSEVSVTVKDGKITNVVWDSVDANGNKKSVQSMNGEYVMTDNGPTWAEQAEALAAYVIENQSLSGITLNEEGKTDAVASVSIAITDFVDLVGNCLEQASGTAVDTVVTDEKEDNKSEESNEDSKEETTDGTKVDAVSGATISTKAVLTGINNAFEYLQRTVVK
ncbi:FMN-binding protein [Clostridium sp. Marseille-P299]|uniref:FMN-binding protein n=1 Tax=Clostridium sp. Marseille-P299 TaxID=1805477 RepID=UPI000833F350|nr:FMN-binding protein [Clostridium sp. Marseille-P299]